MHLNYTDMAAVIVVKAVVDETTITSVKCGGMYE